ncbi:DUF6083 domain-containing protein [Kitasatospora sp. NPDC050543]|uniref:DUF6083 domain-containing protein n=1 Tax=Kitasatospora sp. NPDC050543 TaxID=3364054 RepID=UPI003799150B
MPSRDHRDEHDSTDAPRSGQAVRQPAVCAACGDPLTPWTAVLGLARCASCAPASPPGPAGPDREPVSLGEALLGAIDELGRAGRLLPLQRTSGTPAPVRTSGTVCRNCGARADWHRTPRGGWILIEPGSRPTSAVRPGHRWRIAGDGTAVNLGSASPSDTCRISHFDICPGPTRPLSPSAHGTR